MNAKQALATLVRAALGPGQLMAGPALQLQRIILGELEAPQVDSSAIESLKTENTDLVLRVAELEEQLAEAKKPRRRTRKKNDADSGDTGAA